MKAHAKLIGIKDDFGFWGTIWGVLILRLIQIFCVWVFFMCVLILWGK